MAGGPGQGVPALLQSRQLDRARPLWEMYVIEGLDSFLDLPEGSFALLTKTHHAALDLQHDGELITRLHDLSPEAADWLGDKGYDDKMGARPLGRVIQEHIKKPLAEELLFGKLTKGGVVRVTVKDDAIDLQVQEPQKPRLTGQKPPLLTAE